MWTEYVVCLLLVRFSQASIHPFFYCRGFVTAVLHKILHVPQNTVANSMELLLVPPFAPIRILSVFPPEENDSELWALDNRRLYALQLAAIQRWPSRCVTKVLVADHLPRKKFKTNYRKFKTQTRGRSVQVVAKYQTFDEWNWFNAALEKEMPGLTQNIGTLFGVFEVLPIICIFIMWMNAKSSGNDHDRLVRSAMFIILAIFFAVDTLRQKYPKFERFFAERHVRAITDGAYWTVPPSIPLMPLHGHVTAPYLCYFLFVGLFGSLPYIFAFLGRSRLRSSIFSVWLGLLSIVLIRIYGSKGKTENENTGKLPYLKNDEVENIDQDDQDDEFDDGEFDEKPFPKNVCVGKQ